MKRSIILFFIIFIQVKMTAQEMGYNTTDIGGEFQWYKAGTITGLHIAFNSKLHHSVLFRIGYNKTDRKDWGEHNDEKGSGWGGTVGYRYYFNPFPHKFFIGARTDVWRMTIDWKDGLLEGTSKTWTIQPTFETGYTFFVNDQMFITPSLANGVEINMKTDGQDVGHGFITLLGISLGVRL
jgi:hypothetical protein